MGVQHDLYFSHPGQPEIAIDGMRTLWWIWNSVVAEAERRRRFIPWIDRHFERMRRVDRFNHKLLQLHHEHIAAFHRWTMPRVARRLVSRSEADAYPMDLLDSWRGFLSREIPALLSSRDALLAFAKLMLYRNFDASDQAADALHDILMRRYGFECVTDVWWAADVAARALPGCGPCGCPGSMGEAHVQDEG
jgi:hypothetical protein